MADVATDTTPSPPLGGGTDLSQLLKPDPKTLENLTTIKQQEIEKKAAITSQMQGQQDADLRRVRAAFDATGIGPDQLPKWNEEAEREKFHTNPVEAFGSLGSVFGILASAFTHAPMENALNASAAAMNAIREGDAENYERAHRAWKENTDLALKRHAIMRERYSDAIQLMNTNMAAGKQKFELAAMEFGDKKALALLQGGYDEDINKLLESRIRSAEGLERIQKMADDRMQNARRVTIYNNIIKSLPPEKQNDPQAQLDALNQAFGLNEAWQQQAMRKFTAEVKPDGTLHTGEEIAEFGKSMTPFASSGKGIETAEYLQRKATIKEQLRQANRDMNDDELDIKAGDEAKRQISELKQSTKPVTKSQREEKERQDRIDLIKPNLKAANPGMSDAELNVKAAEEADKQLGIVKAQSSGRALTAEQLFTLKKQEEHQGDPNYLANDFAKDVANYKKNMKSPTIKDIQGDIAAELKDKYLLENFEKVKRGEMTQSAAILDAENRAVREATASVKPGPTLSPETIDLEARKYIRNGRLPVGMGRQQADLDAILNRASDIAVNELHYTGDQLATLQQGFGAQAAGQRALMQRLARVEQSVVAAIKMGDLVHEASEAAPRGQFTIINRGTQAVAAVSSNPKLAGFVAQLNGYANVYATAISGGNAGEHAAAKEKFFAMINTAMGTGAVQAVVDTINREMRIEIESNKEAMKNFGIDPPKVEIPTPKYGSERGEQFSADGTKLYRLKKGIDIDSPDAGNRDNWTEVPRK